MALPSFMETTLIKVSAPLSLLDTVFKARITVIPSGYIVWGPTGEALVPMTEIGTGASAYEFLVPSVDQPGFVDSTGTAITGFHYTVSVTYSGGGSEWTVTKTVQPLSDQDELDFDLIPFGNPDAPTFGNVGYVTSVNGLTGAVDVGIIPGVKGDQGDPGPAGTTTWAGITGKPSTFFPVVGNASFQACAGDDPRLSDARTPIGHTHTIGNVLGLQAALDAKLESGSFVATTDPRLSDARTPLAHTHTIANVTGLQAAIDGKQDAGSYATTSALTAGLGTKANTSHSHPFGDVTGLQAALDAKADTSHTHTIANVTGLQAALDAKAATSHTHTIANVTGLQAGLDAKANLSDVSDTLSGTTDTTIVRRNLGRVKTETATDGDDAVNKSQFDTALATKGTSNLALGTTSTTAKAGDYQPTWTQVTSKPTTFAPIIGATSTTAVAGNDTRLTNARTPTAHSHGIADLPAGTTISVYWTGTAWPARPTARTDVTVQWISDAAATAPSAAVANVDLWWKDLP